MELDFFEENFSPNKKTHSYKGPLLVKLFDIKGLLHDCKSGLDKKRLKVFLYALNVLKQCFKTVLKQSVLKHANTVVYI